jgi:hypothetical protein
MRLIETTTFKLVEFPPDDLPRYAILSHTWGLQEVTLHEFSSDHAAIKQREGYKKIKSCCDKAWETQRIRFCWVDTCCIDKSSSVELSEAINSMFKWYSQAAICYVYLPDVESGSISATGFDDDMKKSRWFTRGWTLQELLAPKKVTFFNRDWTPLGSKRTHATTLSTITGIDADTLLDPSNLFTASIARRMSWAASRQTTRREDTAYCLMGIFNVNMPLLYGEGERAFIRLQEEIIKESNDQSILAWDTKSINIVEGWHTLGILARHPSLFQDAGGIELLPAEGHPMTMTNRGLQVQLPVVDQGDGVFAAVTNCIAAPADDPYYEISYQLAVPIQLTSFGDGSFGRHPRAPLRLVPEVQIGHCRSHTVYLWKFDIATPKKVKSYRPFDFELRMPRKSDYNLQKSIYTTKPLNDLTVFRSWSHTWSYSIKHSVEMTLDFPLERSDCVAAFHFVHVADSGAGIAVLLESRRARERWSVRIVSCVAHADLENVVKHTFGSSQRILKDDATYNNKKVRVDAALHRLGTVALDRKKAVVEGLTTGRAAGFKHTRTRLTVAFFPKEDISVCHELHGECLPHAQHFFERDPYHECTPPSELVWPGGTDWKLGVRGDNGYVIRKGSDNLPFVL